MRVKYGNNSTNFNDNWVRSFSTSDDFVKASEGGGLLFVTDHAKREQMLRQVWQDVTKSTEVKPPANNGKGGKDNKGV